MCWFDTFVYFNMIITVMLAKTSVTSLRCQYGSRGIRKVKTWGGGAEKEEGAWNRSVKGQIIKALQALLSLSNVVAQKQPLIICK